MEQKNNIFIKLELTKNPQAKTLTLTAHINPQAPNIMTFEDHISWVFTEEEQDFLYDAITLVRNKQQTISSYPEQKTILSPCTEQITDKAINDVIEKHSNTPHYSTNTQEIIDTIIKGKNNIS